MEADVTERLGAGPHERTPERLGQRNGHRPRLFDSRAGALELAIPKLRTGSYFPDWPLEPRRRAERALVAVIQEAYVKGVSITASPSSPIGQASDRDRARPVGRHGELGDGTTTNRTSPVRVTGLTGVVRVAAGSNHSLAAWGYNLNGRLGDGTSLQPPEEPSSAWPRREGAHETRRWMPQPLDEADYRAVALRNRAPGIERQPRPPSLDPNRRHWTLVDRE